MYIKKNKREKKCSKKSSENLQTITKEFLKKLKSCYQRKF